MKKHHNMGEIHGWGRNNIYCHLQKSETIHSISGPHKSFPFLKAILKKVIYYLLINLDLSFLHLLIPINVIQLKNSNQKFEKTFFEVKIL